MSAEPDYLRQSGEEMNLDEAREWFSAAATEARAEGMTYARFSVHPDKPNLRIVEAWKVRPADEGEVRWQLTADRP